MKKDELELRKRAEAALRGLPDDTINLFEDMQHLIHELRVHQIELEIQNEELRRAQQEIEASRNRFSDLYDLAPVGYFTINSKGIIQEVNLTAANLLGVERKSLISNPFSKYIHRDDQDTFYLNRLNLLETKEQQSFDMRLLKKRGHEFYAHIECMITNAKGKDYDIQIAVTDVSDRKRAEDELQKAHKALERRVKQRTKKLAGKTKELEEANTALRVLLKRRDADRSDLQDNILYTLKLRICPSIERLSKSALDRAQRSYLDIITSNLDDLSSSFAKKLSSKYFALSAMEIQIANHVKDGMSSKEIAATLNISINTVLTYRKRIRKKFKINKKPTNLRTYLQSLKA